MACLLFAQPVRADYVGEVQTTKYLDQQTIDMITARYQSGLGGLVVGDEISYFIQFTPTNNGGMVGAGGYVTDYLPAGTEVVNAQFVRINADGSFTQIAPPPPAAVKAGYVPMYSETGIFFSSDPRTAVYTNPASPTISITNGYPAAAPSTTHNLWDNQMWATYSGVPRVNNVGCPVAPLLALGSSPVAGPDTYLNNDYTGSQGPWQRISYPGSMFGTLTGVAQPINPAAPTVTPCIGGTPTSAGWALSSSNPLPANTNAVRFAAGRVTVGELFSVRITLRLTQPVPATGLINNTEVFGGDASLDPGSKAGKDNMWKYHFPNVANADTTLTVLKRITGMCTGVGCIPAAYSGGAVPDVANLKLRYDVLYLNSSGGTQTNVQLSDILPTGGALVAGSEAIISGPNILPTTAVAGGFNFQTLASLGSGSGGTVRFDVNFAAAPAANAALSNTARLTSFAVPGGVASVATTTATLNANLNANKTTSTPTRTPAAPNNVATYTITIPNNGAGIANTVTVYDYLPSAGGATINDRFSYQAGSAVGSVTSGGITTPVALTVTNAVAATAPYIGLNREQVTFTPAAGTTIPSGGSMTITFNAVVGSNVPATATPYLNDMKATYLGGFATAPALSTSQANGIAPVTVIVPMTLTKSIDCVYSGAVCAAYTSGTIPTASKIRYRLSYANTSGAALAGVALTDTLPLNTSFVAGTAAEVGTPYGIVPPAVAGQLLTFGTIASLPAAATGAVTFDVQLGAAALIPSGSYITNNAKLTSTAYPGGVTASLTTTVRDQANLVVTKTTSTPSIAVNGIATYTITVTNTGNTAAGNIRIYDELPFTGLVALATGRFNFTVGSSVISAPMTAVVPTTVVPPTQAGYTANLNQQEVQWNFGAVQTLAPGASFTITFTAQAGTTIPAGSTIYKNNVRAVYTSGATTLYSGATNTAPVTIPTNLTISKSIDCVYNAALTACNAYNGSGIIPVNAKVRYKIHYANIGAIAQTTVYICDQLSSTQAAPVFAATITTPPTLAPTPAGPFTNTAAPNGPPVGAVTNPAAAACGFAATGVRFSYPMIPSLAAGASGDVYFDAATNMASTFTLSNTGKIVSTQSPAGETSVVSATARDVPVLQITKSTTTPNLSPGGTATYTISVTNSGNLATSSLKVYDFLPYSGSAQLATKQFTYLSTTGYTKNGLPFAPTTPTIGSVTPPAIAPYNTNANQQQVTWDFGAIAGNQLAPGDTLAITFTASVGSAMPAGTYGNSMMAEFTSASGPGSVNANNAASITLANNPSIIVLKTVAIFSDPVNGTTNPKFIPGAEALYTLIVTNSGTGTATADSVVIIDPVPANTLIYLKDLGAPGSGPVAFTDGGTPSGLTYTPATDLSFTTTGGAPWTAVPMFDATTGCDTTAPSPINAIRINPKGTLACCGASFQLTFRVCVQ